MTVDNEVYNRDADHWRDENHFFSMLVPMAEPRVQYVHQVLTNRLRLTPARSKVLDVGCGGGILAEAMAEFGYLVTAVDPSERSIEAAKRHAQEAGLPIIYRVETGEKLPFDNAAFDAVYSLDVLEHVDHLPQVISEIARVTRPGGAFVFDTINRTFMSNRLIIQIMQNWGATSVMPPNFHDWAMFIKPEELATVLERYRLRVHEIVGFGMSGNPLQHIQMFRKRKRGALTYADAGRYIADHMSLNEDKSVVYGGYAIKGA